MLCSSDVRHRLCVQSVDKLTWVPTVPSIMRKRRCSFKLSFWRFATDYAQPIATDYAWRWPGDGFKYAWRTRCAYVSWHGPSTRSEGDDRDYLEWQCSSSAED